MACSWSILWWWSVSDSSGSASWIIPPNDRANNELKIYHNSYKSKNSTKNINKNSFAHYWFHTYNNFQHFFFCGWYSAINHNKSIQVELIFIAEFFVIVKNFNSFFVNSPLNWRNTFNIHKHRTMKHRHNRFKNVPKVECTYRNQTPLYIYKKQLTPLSMRTVVGKMHSVQKQKWKKKIHRFHLYVQIRYVIHDLICWDYVSAVLQNHM